MNPDEINKLIKNSVERLKDLEGFEKVRFIILYGSAVEGITRQHRCSVKGDHFKPTII